MLTRDTHYTTATHTHTHTLLQHYRETDTALNYQMLTETHYTIATHIHTHYTIEHYRETVTALNYQMLTRDTVHYCNTHRDSHSTRDTHYTTATLQRESQH